MPDGAAASAASTALNPVLRSEPYDVYTVSRSTTVVTLDGENAEMVEFDAQRLAATGSSAGGTALVRHNWYPRWRATVNGRPAPITRTAEGYMSVAVPAGEVRIELVYGVDRLDWLARALSALGFVGGGWLALGRRLARAPRFGPAP